MFKKVIYFIVVVVMLIGSYLYLRKSSTQKQTFQTEVVTGEIVGNGAGPIEPPFN